MVIFDELLCYINAWWKCGINVMAL